MANLILAIIFALLFTLTLNISKGVQKYGIAGLSVETIKNWKDKPELKRNFRFWTIGSIGTVFASIFQLIAQPYTPNSSFVPAFSGIGLLGLIIFSFIVLKEEIKIPEIIGTIIIIIATFIFGLNANTTETTEINYTNLILFLIIPIGFLFLLAYLSNKNEFKGHAIIWGSTAGFCSGFSIVLSHTAAIEGDRAFLGMLLTWNIIFSLVLAQGAFWFTQIGFKHGDASVVVTMYTSLALIVPILVDYIALNYEIPFIQLSMLMLILLGDVLLTAFRKPTIQ